jgi:Domain of unknown function (DUF4258)
LPRLTIARLRERVRNLEYSVSLHAAEELEDDDLTILDLESILLSGQIIERQRDRTTRETKYVFQGATIDGQIAACVIKIGPTGRLYVLTVYRD